MSREKIKNMEEDIMNIQDVTLKKKRGDKLDLIFTRQRELMKKYYDIEKKNGAIVPDKIPVDLDSREGQYRLKDLAQRVVEELMESMNCLHNKSWKNTMVATDKEHYFEELGDCIHFLIELCITSGMTAETFFETYYKKSEVNKFRIRSNY